MDIVSRCTVTQKCTNTLHCVVKVTDYFMVVPDTCEFLVSNLLHFTLLAPRILRRLLDF